jgi:thiol:disulfide interchange protein
MIRLLAVLLALVTATTAEATGEDSHVKAELVAETNALLRGGDSTVALRLTPESGWHTYWLNPGDSGLPTKLEWALPVGIQAGPLQFPAPHAAPLAELTNYGYERATLHLSTLSVTPDWPAAAAATLRARAKWLACKDVCIPGSADLTLTLPVADRATPDAAVAAEFERTRAELPEMLPSTVQAQFQVADGALSLSLRPAPLAGALKQLEFFPLAGDLVNHAAAQRIAVDAQGWRLTQALSAYYVHAPEKVQGWWVATTPDGSRHVYDMQASAGTVVAVAANGATALGSETAAVQTATAQPGLALALLLSLSGGLILNLMPCVFPVLSLKALSLLASSVQDRRQQRRQALAYTAGAVLSCVVAAGVLLALRAGGEALGWGFQLQSSTMVALLAWLMLALGLSMSGLVEFGGRLMNAGSALAARQGLAGSFFTGVLAVVVASPCTAPFMGTALGYAITQPAVLALTVFAALGLGLALPFLLLGFVPALARALPRPGAWMLTFKQVMAFPLYLTAAWLAWVLTRQAGADALGLLLVGAVLVSFALWLLARPARGITTRGLIVLSLLAAAALLGSPIIRNGSSETPAAKAKHEAWSVEKVAALRAEGKTLFVDFTADWCLTCKVNERGALASDTVQKAFAEKGVVSLVADWTSSDPAITAALAQFGRNGVPLYLVYLNGREPRVLPQVLTPGIVVDALNP